MRYTFLLPFFVLMAASCEDKPQAQNTDTAPTATSDAQSNMPGDESIKIVSEAMGKPESEVRAYFEKCVAEGGKGIIGGFGQYACEKPTADAGKACTQDSDCEGACLSDSKTCTPKKPMFGCYGTLPRPGMEAVLCVD